MLTFLTHLNLTLKFQVIWNNRQQKFPSITLSILGWHILISWHRSVYWLSINIGWWWSHWPVRMDSVANNIIVLFILFRLCLAAALKITVSTLFACPCHISMYFDTYFLCNFFLFLFPWHKRLFLFVIGHFIVQIICIGPGFPYFWVVN